MVNFQPSAKLRALVEESDWPESKKKQLLASKTLPHGELVDFYRQCRPTSSLLELLSMASLDIPNKSLPSEKPKSEEFVKSMELLRLRAEEDAYQKLVNPRPAFGRLYEEKFDDEPYNPARAHKETKSHVTTIFNIFISVASVVYAIWYWTDSSWKLKQSYRVLLCLFFGLLILVAEVVVYMAYLQKVEDAKIKERKKKEVKKVIRSFTVN